MKVSRAFNLKHRQHKPLYMVIYLRMFRMKEWSEASDRKIRRKDLADPVIYNQNRHVLVDRIITVLTETDGPFPVRAYLDKAIALGAFKQARDAFEEGLKNALEREDIWGVIALLKYNRDLIESHDFHLAKKLSLPDLANFHQNCQLDLRLSGFYEELKEIALQEETQGRFPALRIEKQLAQLHSEFTFLNYKIQRLRSRALLLAGDTKAAHELQLDLVERADTNLIEKGLLLQDISLLVQLSVDIGLEEKAAYWTFKLGQIPLARDIDQILKQQLLVKNAMIIACQYWRFDLCEYAMARLIEQPSLFDPRKRSTLIYSGILAALGTGSNEEAREWWLMLKAIPKKQRPHLSWQLYLLKTVLDFELGYDPEPGYRAARRHLGNLEWQIPLKALQLIKKVYHSPFAMPPVEVSAWEKTFEVLLQDPGERNCYNFFDVLLWLRAKASSTTMAEVDRGERSHEQICSRNSVAFL